jgi:hypothetical protein
MPTFAATQTATVLPPDQQAEADKRANDRAEQAAALAPKPADTNKVVADLFEKIASALRPAPAPTINVAPPAVTVTMPEIKQGDTFVEIGPTTVSAPRGERSVRYTRDERGELVGEITETVTRKVRAEKTADGKIVGNIAE